MPARPTARPRRTARAVVAPLLALALLAGCDAGAEPAGGSATAAVEEAAVPEDGLAGTALDGGAADAAIGAAAPTTALAALADLEVKGRAPRTGYDRDLFGAGWVDTDRNGCDTRNDVLARDLAAETFEPGTRDCVVLTGTLADPYSGRTIAFQRGQGTSEAVQIDHVVALSDAWQKGAQQWDAATRTRFANDPLNLLAVDGPLNMQKGDGDAATWLPPARTYRCAYVARQVAVKLAYGAWVTQAEKNTMATVLSACPAEPLPGGVAAELPQAAPAPAPAPAPSASYANCTQVKAAGAAPIRVGDPGWQPKFDRDGDGVGCES
ncbi:GmrSD restriction endonuclease domain-containing protein [Blastococcus sp. SYSU D01042]